MLICLYDDRPANAVGLKLAVLSLQRHCPGEPIVVHAPQATPHFISWISARTDATLVTEPTVLGGWNVKPELLLRHLSDSDEVVWFDSDLMCAADWRPLVAASRETLVATEETARAHYLGGSHRAVAWDLTPTRALSTTLNTCLTRVTREHVGLLERWRTMLVHPRYQQAQMLPMFKRPQHLLSDQEVLTGLLSDAEFHEVPVRFLRQGRDIVHCFGPSGYLPSARVRMAAARRIPPLLHAMGQKPWELSPVPENLPSKLRGAYERAHGRLSPYTQAARDYLGDLDEPAPWLERARPGWTATTLSCSELPLAMVDNVIRRSRTRMGVARHTVEGLDSPLGRPGALPTR